MNTISYTQHHGVDASHYQVMVDMHAAQASGIEFWAEKASEGMGTDPLFASDNRQARMRETFAVRIFYHFCHCDIDATVQGAHFANLVGPLQPNEYLAFDVEQGWGDLAGAAAANYLIDVVQSAQSVLGITDEQVIVYGSLGWLRGQFGEALSMLTRFHLWAARYAPALGDTSPWSAALIWQDGDYGTVAGVGSGTVDTDIFLDDHWPVSP